ncbi:copper amine oxidase N-terminal domain-containing protein [Paenibacillus sp. LjRoot153]|uniref:copper amine oxidase N-terminal domain-containing protein n=1 Tax=Paenibacillus sp. LjRoot153 TaxID=3342270 RepID=UPI003ECC4812
MKKILLLMLLLSFSYNFANTLGYAQEAQEISVYYNDRLIKFDNHPFINEGSTFVQFRPLFEQFNYEISWDDTTNTITARNANTKIEMTVGSDQVRVNEEVKTFDNSIKLIDGNAFVPLRFVSETSGAYVYWDNEQKIIKLVTDTYLDEIAIINTIEEYMERDTFLMTALRISKGTGIKRNETLIKKIIVDKENNLGEIVFDTGFEISATYKEGKNIVIKPQKEILIEFNYKLVKNENEWGLFRFGDMKFKVIQESEIKGD